MVSFLCKNHLFITNKCTNLSWTKQKNRPKISLTKMKILISQLLKINILWNLLEK